MKRIHQNIVMIVIILAIILITNLPITIADDKPKPASSPIAIPSNVQELIKQANRDIEIAQLKKDNLVLQIRLLLTVPNNYSYDEANAKFNPPLPEPKKDSKP